MRLLFLTSRLPFPPNRGDRLRTYHLLRNLGSKHEITLLSFVSGEEEAGNAAKLQAFCKEICLIRRPAYQSVVTAAGNFWRSLPLQLLYYKSRKMQRLVDSKVAGGSYDAAYIHLFRMAPFMAKIPSLYRIVDLTDMISAEVAASLPYRSLLSRIIYHVERPRIISYERQVASWAEETWLISDRDRLLLAESHPQANLQTVTNGVDLDRFYPIERQREDTRLVFVGNLNVFHNSDAVSFLVDAILPRVRQEIPACTVDIVGPGQVDSIDSGKVQGVRVRGFVPDLNQALNEAAVFVAPLRFSAGIQNKVLEAMAAGLPVVTTSNVNDGLAAQPGEDLLVGDTADELALHIVSLIDDAAMRHQMGQTGRRFVEQRFSWQVAVDRLDQIEQLLSEGETQFTER